MSDLELEKLKTIALTSEVRYNHNHDAKGRFSSGGGSGGGGGKKPPTDGKGTTSPDGGKEPRKYGETDTSEALKEIKSGKSNSLKDHVDKNGKLTAEREEIHKEIINEKLEGKEAVDGQATMTMLGGGPASGKSSVMSTKNLDSNTMVVDPDALKEALPGYSEMSKITAEAAPFYHEESSALAKRLAQTAYTENVNVIYDGTGDGSVKSVEKKIAQAREKGYRVEAKYVTIDTEEAVRRNQKRYEDGLASGENPRLVPDGQVRSCHAKVTDISVATAPKFDHIEVWDNNGERGAQVKIAEGGNGKYLKAVKGQEQKFQNYLAKGERGLDGFIKLPDGQVMPADDK